jgi:hypothetical protein
MVDFAFLCKRCELPVEPKISKTFHNSLPFYGLKYYHRIFRVMISPFTPSRFPMDFLCVNTNPQWFYNNHAQIRKTSLLTFNRKLRSGTRLDFTFRHFCPSFKANNCTMVKHTGILSTQRYQNIGVGESVGHIISALRCPLISRFRITRELKIFNNFSIGRDGEPICIEHQNEAMVVVSNGNVYSAPRRPLAADFAFPPLRVNWKSTIAS